MMISSWNCFLSSDYASVGNIIFNLVLINNYYIYTNVRTEVHKQSENGEKYTILKTKLMFYHLKARHCISYNIVTATDKKS